MTIQAEALEEGVREPRDRRPRPLPHRVVRVRFFDQWWVAICALAMMVASDFKWRTRPVDQALSGKPDMQVLIEIGVYASVGLFLFVRHSHAPRLRRTSNLMFAVWMFAIVLIITAFYAAFPKLGLVRAVQLLIIASFVQTVASRATVQHLHRLAHGFMVLIAMSIALGFAIHMHTNIKIVGRFRWLEVHPVSAGMFLMSAFIIAAAYLRSGTLRRVLGIWPHWMYGAMVAWLGMALVLTKTRGSVGGGLVGLAIIACYQTRPRTKIDIGVLAASAFGAFAVFMGPAAFDYINRGQSAQTLSTLNSRTDLWAVAFHKIAEKPVTGWGLGASKGIFLDQINLGGGHNAFVDVMVDAGVIGTAAFVAVLVFAGAGLLRARHGTIGHREALLLAPVFFGLLVNSMTAEYLAAPTSEANLWLLVICAWIEVTRRADRAAERRRQAATARSS